MDRNTLLAFFLIALVLLLTPKYMELFSPTVSPKKDFVDKNVQKESEANKKTQVVSQSPAIQKQKFLNKNLKNKTGKEKTAVVETPLYRAVISSYAGGTIKEFYIKNHFTPDSQTVSLINQGAEEKNLELYLRDLDGQKINLSTYWETKSKSPEVNISDILSLEYRVELFSGDTIIKTLIFDPTSYSIKINLNLKNVRQGVYRDATFSWEGGLSTTEKDTKDDKTYFKSYIYQGGEIEELKTKPGKIEEKTYNGATEWSAIRTKYFVSALIPNDPLNIRSSVLSGRNDSLELYNSYFIFDAYKDISFTLFLGPLEYERVRALGVNLDEIMDFGWAFIRPISKGVLYTLKRMHDYIPNYGYVLILFSFIVKILVFPLTRKSYQSTAALQVVQPQVNALKEKYKNNPQKLNQATMKLYKEKGVNPLGGCLPMLLQMPLLFALFIVFRTTIELRNEPFLFWIKDLSSPDIIFNLPFTIPLYGAHVAFLPILMAISTFIQQKMMTGGAVQPQQKMMQYFMMIFFFLIFNNFPSGLNLYYTLFNVLTIAQQKLLPSTKQKT